ncbi:MAG: HAMP domain-containing histidine kinase, partial [Clostridiales bacterium]|nr:HAMP domain-containing histidine kinase [Clostridiales bacterium]
GYVLATTPIRGNSSFLADVMQMFLLSAIAACLLAFVGAYFLSYRMLRPLHQMSKAVKQFSEGDFSYRVQVQGNDELSDLAQGFNEMALALATLEGSRRSFVANVSHELKTPMTTISGFIDGILDGTIPQEKQSYYLGIVSDEVKRLSRLVVAMLNMSKIETGDFQVKKREYDISEQIFRVLLTFEQKINEKNLEIVGMDQLSSVMVNADADIIYQVIYNLVDNAVKFTNVDGYISLSAVQEETRVVVRIKNSGAGIAPEELPKIFERFYKVDRSRSLDVKGSGLGLYLVKNMIELHGGQITVFSTENESTEFVFWLPNKERGKSDE